MEPFNFVKSLVLNFRFDSCCWIAPVRIGLILTGYFNALIAIICIIGTANESLNTTLMQVQTALNDETVTTTAPMMAYITEVGFSVLCLCGIYRKDLVLLRVYMYYCMAALVLSIMVYSIVILAIDMLIQISIICGILFQLYVLLLVRSAIVEIKWEQKKSQLPTLVMSSLVHEKEASKEQVSIKSQDSKNEHDQSPDQVEESAIEHAVAENHEATSDDVEKGPEPEPERKNGHKKDVDAKLETVNEEVSP